MFDFEKLRSSHIIFILYIAVSSALIMLFRFIFPYSETPLAIFFSSWRVTQGVLTIFNLFPALAFSALVIPFGIAIYDEYPQSFSQVFFKRLISSVISAICAACLYCAILFLIFPMVKNHEEDMRFKGDLYNLAKSQAQECIIDGKWQEAAHFVSVCDKIWEESPGIADLKAEIDLNLAKEHSEESDERAEARVSLTGETRSMALSSLPGSQQPLDAAEAILLAEEAFAAHRFYDAHWLATLGERLSVRGSPQAANASRLASRAWNQIASQSPNRREEKLYSLFNLKRSGYEAMNSGEWVDAYYIFLELLALTPDDPDAANFLAASEMGTREVAFFTDEMRMAIGELMTGAVFSLPAHGGRAVIRLSNLSLFQDYAYGMGLEYMKVDEKSRPVVNMTARYVKILPFSASGVPQVLVMTHALDRQDKNANWDGEWTLGRKANAGIILDIKYEDFLLLSKVRHGLTNLQIDELFEASEKFGSAGYVSRIFDAEVLNRLGSAVFFLPMAIVVIIIGWRLRTKTRPRYLFFPLLLILPVVFHAFVFLYRSVLNTLSIWLVLSLGFSPALVIFIIFLAVTFFFSLILLASQRS